MNGEIGNVEIVMILFCDLFLFFVSYIKSLGGLFCDMMIYDLDMVCFLLGEEFVLVYVVGVFLVDFEIGEVGDVDIVVVILIMVSGKIC